MFCLSNIKLQADGETSWKLRLTGEKYVQKMYDESLQESENNNTSLISLDENL